MAGGGVPVIGGRADGRVDGPTDAVLGEMSSDHPPLRPSASFRNWPRLAGWYLIRGYQLFLSPALPRSCRFTPSCSQYTLEAVNRYGLVRGSWLGFKRLLRCHPFHRGGFDPVP